jgi:hypothetical protein
LKGQVVDINTLQHFASINMVLLIIKMSKTFNMFIEKPGGIEITKKKKILKKRKQAQ